AVPPPDPHASPVVREFAAAFPDVEPHERKPAPASAVTPRRPERQTGIRYVAGGRWRVTRQAAVLGLAALAGLTGIGWIVANRSEPVSGFDGYVYVESNGPTSGANTVLA